MSYVERAFYDYLKSTMTSGVRMLLERRLILFSFFLVIIGVVNTALTYLYKNEKDAITVSTLEGVFLLELAIAIGFICAGLLSPLFRLRSTLGRFLVLIFSSAIFFAVGFIGESQQVDETFLEWIPIFLLFSWALFIPLSTFAFAHGLFSNKITGSVLFLGKPSADRRAIFWGPIFLLALGVGIVSIFLLLNEEIFIGISGIIVGFIIIFAVLGHLVSDDVFSTSLGFFFLLSIPQFILLIVTGTASGPVSTINFILLIFSLLYGAQSVSKTIRKRDQRLGKIEIDSKEEIELSLVDKFILKVGGEGVVLMLLGCALGYHLVQLEMYADFEIPLIESLDAPSVGFVYHLLAWSFMILIIFAAIVLFRFNRRFRNHYTADIYRMDFLPPYEELVDFFGRMRRGEVSWSRLLGKYAKYAAVEGVKRGVGRLWPGKGKKANEE